MEGERVDRMNFEEKFQSVDIRQASKKYWEVLGLLSSTANNLQAGDLDVAKQLSTELTMSLHDLSKISDRKDNEERYQTLMQQLVSSGTDVQMVRRYLFDK